VKSSIVGACCALVLAFVIKRMYSHAGAEDLQWILAPSCWLVSALGGVQLASGFGAGFISHEHRMVVGPACAGVNFFVIATLALYFCQQGSFTPLTRKLSWLGQCLALAYVATILSNGLRILVAAHLYSWDIYGGWLTPERLHRGAGSAIYCASLFALCAVVGRWIGAEPRTVAGRSIWASTRIIPAVCYLGIAVGVPLLNRAYSRDSKQFLEHSAMVIAVCAAILALTVLARLAMDRLCSR
jgi:exosortase K